MIELSCKYSLHDIFTNNFKEHNPFYIPLEKAVIPLSALWASLPGGARGCITPNYMSPYLAIAL
jgi:hypothetical protein